MSCTVGTMKYGVLVSNFILVCAGVYLLFLGFKDIDSKESLKDFKEYVDSMSIATKIIAGTGLILFIVASLGCWGAFQESSFLLYWYALFLLALIFVQVVFGIYVFVHRDTVYENTEASLKLWLKDYDKDKNAQSYINFVQTEFKCCGVQGPADWAGNIPDSCCEDPKQGKTCDNNKIYKKGCLDEVLDEAKAKTNTILYVIGGILLFEGLLLIFTLIVRNSINSREHYMYA